VSQGKPHHETTGGVIGTYMTEIIRNAARRGYPVYVTMDDLSRQWELQQGKCALTGWDLTLRKTARDFSATASLDRIDSRFTYLPYNIQWCHKDINAFKSNFPEERFFEMCRAVYQYKDQTKKLRGSRPWLAGS
jgi:hypothetical protein